MANSTNNDIATSRVTLPDIACTSCASVIENYFNKLKNITVNINFGTKKALFTYNRKVWNEKLIQKAMHSLGYEVFIFDTDKQNLDTNHEHSSEEHQVHMEDLHSRGHLHNIKLRDLIEIIVGWIVLIPLLLIEIPNISLFDVFKNPYVQLGLTIPIQFYFGRKFYSGIYRELVKQKFPGMHTLIALSTNFAFIFSIYLMVINDTFHLFFEVSASIVMIVLLGDLISNIMQKKATNGLESLMSLQPKSILRYNANTKKEEFVNLEDVQLNDILIVRKGESIPTDGLLLSKSGLINESMLTGESQVINKTQNQNVIGGTINTGESIHIKTTKIGKDTVLASIIKAIEDVQAQKPQLQKIADKIAAWFTPTIIIIALLVFIIRFWAEKDSLQQSLIIAISTLIIACPCALGIATPLAVAVGINKAAKLEIIYNKASAFEKITKIDTICFDKTGTLTTGNLMITEVYGQSKNINKALALEKYSTHPLALAFSLYVKTNNVTDSPSVENIKEEIGYGLKGKCGNENLQISSLVNLQIAKMPLSPFLINQKLDISDRQKIVLALAINKVITNIFVLSDQLQENAVTTIAKIRKQGIKVVLISGDNEQQTANIAKRVKIENYYANIKPVAKAQLVAHLQTEGQKVAFVGDGINDVVALQQADLAIVMGAGSDIAKKIGDITITSNDISAVYKAIVLTKKTKNNIWINFIWAFGYNLVIIPLAALGFIIPPLAAAAMAFSDITVIANSLIFKSRKYKY